MKTQFTLLLSLLMMSLSPSAFAEQSHHFVFRHKADFESTRREPQQELPKFEYTVQADSYESAFKKAAKACFQHFKGERSLSETEGLTIIDTCANPRGS